MAKDLLSLTVMEEAQKTVLTREYRKAKGNISLTARLVGWSRSKTLYMAKEWGLYNLYPHKPGPIPKRK